MPRKKASPDDGTVAVSAPVLPDQAELFSPDVYPARPDLVAMVKAKSFTHNGSLLTKDEELCRNVCRDLLMGASDRQIARKWRISRSSIVPIEMAMRVRGELEPLRQEVSNLLGEIILLGGRNYRDALAAGLINPMQIPIPMCAVIDKKGQLDGNVIPGTSLPAPELSAEDIAREIEEMKRLTVIEMPSLDTQSAVPPAKPA